MKKKDRISPYPVQPFARTRKSTLNDYGLQTVYSAVLPQFIWHRLIIGGTEVIEGLRGLPWRSGALNSEAPQVQLTCIAPENLSSSSAGLASE